MFLLDSFLACNVLKITCSIPMEFNLNFKIFVLITIYLVFCLKNKTFVVTAQKFYTKGSYWIKPCERMSFLVQFILFTICITSLLVKILFSIIRKSDNFIVSLFCTIFKYRMIITFLFLTLEHEKLFVNHFSVNRSSMEISYRNNIFNNSFNNVNAVLTIFNNSDDFKVWLTALFIEIVCCVEASQMTLNKSQLTGFSMMWDFNESCLRANFYFSPNVNVNVIVVSNMHSNSSEITLHNFLQQWIYLIICRTMKLESTSEATLFETNSQILLFLYSSSMYFWSIHVIWDWHIS